MKNCNLKLSKLSLWLLVFTFSTTGIKAQNRFTIQDCILYAFEHNPLIHVGIKDSSIAGVGVQRVKGLYLPRVGLASAGRKARNIMNPRGITFPAFTRFCYEDGACGV